MHLNPPTSQHPNILSDMQAAGSPYSFNGRIGIDRYGNECTIWDHRRHLIPRKSYPYASERQNKRRIRQLYPALSGGRTQSPHK